MAELIAPTATDKPCDNTARSFAQTSPSTKIENAAIAPPMQGSANPETMKPDSSPTRLAPSPPNEAESINADRSAHQDHEHALIQHDIA